MSEELEGKHGVQSLEVGTCRIAGHLPDLEEQAVAWQQGAHQPDSLAALVVAHDVLIHAAGQTIEFGVPLGNVRSMTAFLQQRLSG